MKALPSLYTLVRVSSYCSSAFLGSISCTVRIRTGRLLNSTMFLSFGNIPIMNISINHVPIRTKTARFWTISIMTSMRLSRIWTSNTISPTTLTFWSVSVFVVGSCKSVLTAASRVREGFLAADCVLRQCQRRS